VSTIATDVQTGGQFYTDESGLDAMSRSFDSQRSVGANYYPQVSFSYIEDTTRRLSVVTQQPHGFTSLIPGDAEIMLHRCGCRVASLHVVVLRCVTFHLT
jgi:hypothetical protein